VVNEVQRLITAGQIQPGMRLPPERQLCEQFGVSRTVVREAVRILVTKGLLETRPGIGTTACSLTSQQLTRPLSILMQAHQQKITLDHLHQVRKILEVEIARLAALQANEEDLARLGEIVQSMQEVQGEARQFALLDGEFHQALAATTHNPLLALLLDSIHDLMWDVRLMVQQHPDLAQTVIPDHQRILESIASRQPQAASQAMQEHLDHARLIQERFLAEEK